MGSANPADAVKVAMGAIDPKALKTKEFAGLVYQYGDGSYGATPGVPGSATQSNPAKAIDAVPDTATTLVGTYHTHPLEGTADRMAVAGKFVTIRATNVDQPSGFQQGGPGIARNGGDKALAESFQGPPGMTYGLTQSAARGGRTIDFAPNDQQVHFVASPGQIQAGRVVPFTSSEVRPEQ